MKFKLRRISSTTERYHLLLVIIVCFSSITTCKIVASEDLNYFNATEDLFFFRQRYNMDFLEVKPISDYDDPDQFYSAVAKELNILGKVYEVLLVRYQWSKEDGSHIKRAIIRRANGCWLVLVYRFQLNLDTKKVNKKTMEQRWVAINDNREAVYFGIQQPSAEQLKSKKMIGE